VNVVNARSQADVPSRQAGVELSEAEGAPGTEGELRAPPGQTPAVAAKVTELPGPGQEPAPQFACEGSFIGNGESLSAYHPTRERVIARFEREYLSCILQQTNGNVSEAARIAGVNRATLYRMLERHGLRKSDVVN
jgi:DNA-binding NtrC family response regulator